MADDIEEFIRDHEIQQPILIGHSMGAKVAMTVALKSPKLVKALVSVDNAPVDANLKSNFHQYVRGLREVEERRVRKQGDADEILTSYEKDIAIRQFLLTNLIRSADGEYLRLRVPIKILASNLDNMGDFPYKDPDSFRYDGPTLIIRGTKSHYVADDVLPVIGRFFPKFELIEIDSGHWVVSEKPEEFRRAVVEFVQREETSN